MELPDPDPLALFKRPPSLLFMDVCDYTAEELEAFLRKLDLEELELRCCLDSGGGVRTIPLARSLYFELPFESEHGRRDTLNALCLPGVLFTFHGEDVPGRDSIFASALKQMSWAKSDVGDLVMVLLTFMVRRSTDHSREMRNSLEALELQMQAPEGESLVAGQILGPKRAAASLAGIIEDQLVCVGTLQALRLGHLDLSALADDYGFLSKDLVAADRTMDRVEARLRDLQSSYELRQQEGTNRRLAALTVLSAVFMPLTLMAGIYGMNFQYMPELSEPLAYPLALGSMAAIALAMLVTFKLRGWFD